MKPTDISDIYPDYSKLTPTEDRMQRYFWQIMAALAVIVLALAGIGLADVISAVRSWL